ncbi:MAG: AAA family ATPase [Planctomycetota bacterium]
MHDAVLVRRVVGGEDAVYHPHLDRVEQGVAAAMARLLAGPPALPSIPQDRAIAWAERAHGIELADEQKSAIRMALMRKVAIVTGGPGVGKTTFLRALVAILNQMQVTPALAAPTGRAAKRLAQATGVEASTIHRLLRFDPKTRRFVHDARDPLPHRYVIVDEVSMVDLELMHAVLGALQPACSLLLVGDSDQLPSVGPGSVLRDLIASEVVPVLRLTTIFRQAAHNPIVAAAHRILHGESPRFGGEAGEGIYFLERESSEQVRAVIVSLCTQRIPARLHYDPISEIQTLSPMNRGPVGVDSLNTELQQALNPNGARTGTARDLRVGDRVLQTRNNYDLNVFNGDLGQVRGFARNPDRLQVGFEDHDVTYSGEDIAELRLAYAMSVHRSQGCEFPVVVMPLMMEHRMLLRRNVLYTAITRARRLVALVGSRRALWTAIKDDSLMLRYSDLSGRLRTAVGRG